MDDIARNRLFMQCHFDEDGPQSDQDMGVTPPPLSKPEAGGLIELPPFDKGAGSAAYADLLDIRRSERVYADIPMTGEQLAFMLWSCQGIQRFRGANRMASFRPAPSGGARHPFELYVAVKNVEGLTPGMYRYAPLAHVGEKRAAIEFLGGIEDYEARITAMLMGQSWAAKAPVVLFFSCVPYRAEWRYQDMAHRVMLIDLGHAGQNAMLSAAALGLGSCCMAAYDQALCDQALGLNGMDEYTVYAVSVGAVKPAG